jgi:hypothetical protein
VFQASEGGSVSVGRRKFQSKIGATPAAPIRYQSIPGAVPATQLSRGSGMTPTSSPTLEGGVTLSKTSFTGICLITFACGIVTTVAVDRVRSRTNERDVGARDSDPSAMAAATAPIAAAEIPATSKQAVAAPAGQPAAARTAVAHAAAAPAPVEAAAADSVVVPMPNLAETAKRRPTSGLRILPPMAPRATTATARARLLISAAPGKGATREAAVIKGPTKKGRPSGASEPATEWMDPFSQ